ncbi:class I adenylate-forming enzyme family protein [Gryllotalpicola ginsengisoli]|uniref:class I adenylate-forming enzyme family protein n=1 Tax=Gryllotalpicola ginsengisoli TaxID=444608 RepID=UPI0003B3EDAD|nr:AMP-binding protein [Gryllotalpicola ginsengisoli]
MADSNTSESIQVTVAALIAAQAEARPEAVFLEDARSERTVTFGDLRRQVDRAGAALAAAGVSSDGAVMVALEDPLDFAVAWLATLAAGLRAVPLDPSSSDEAVLTLRGQFRGTVALVAEGREIDGIPTLTPADLDRERPRAARSGDSASSLLFTSGSTGTPKGVELGEAQLLHVARAVARHNALTPDDRGFNPLPLFHINAEVVAVLASLIAGSALVLDRRFRRTGFWQLMAERRITWINAVPAILAILASEGDVTPTPELRFIRSASAPLPEPTRLAFSDVDLVISYGMTEAASQITATPLGGEAPSGSVGRPVETEVEVRDDDGRPLPEASVGQVWIRGPGVVRRYFGGAAADRFDADGWLRTGDLGSFDSDGYLTLVGRSDDVINRGGELVYPGDVEEALLTDPRVREAVVVGKPDHVLGQVPVAFIVPAGDLDETDAAALASALRELAAARLSRAQRPVEITVGTDLPRAATGKVQRARLRASLEERAE